MAFRRMQRDRKSCTEMILGKLQLLVDEGVFSEDDNSFKKLKGTLTEVKDFILDVWKLEDSFCDLLNHVRLYRQEFYSFGLDQTFSGFDSIEAASIFRDFLKILGQQTICLEDFAHLNWHCFYSLLFQDGLPPTGADSCFQENLENLSQQIRDFYIETWDSVVQFFSRSRLRYLRLYHGIPLPSVKVSDFLNERTDGLDMGSLARYYFFQRFKPSAMMVKALLVRGELFHSRFAAVLEPVRVNLELPEKSRRHWWRRRHYESYVFKQCPALDLFTTRLCCCLLRDEIDCMPFERVGKINPAAYLHVWESLSTFLTLSTKAMTSIDSIIDFCKDDHGLNELKVELRLVKTFFLCASKFCHSSKSTKLFKVSVHENWQQFYCFLLELEDGFSPSELAGEISNLRRILKGYRQKISELYVEMLGFSIESRIPWTDGFMEFFHVFMENLEDIVVWGEAFDSRLERLWEPLHEKLVFLRSFILFASLQGKPNGILMEHCAAEAFSAAHLCYVSWVFRDDNQVPDGIDLKISELIDKIKPTDRRARLLYIHVLESESTSPTMSTMKDMIIVGEFVDSLLGHLWELLLNFSSCFMVSLKHQLLILVEGLQFLRNILNGEKYDGLDERVKDLIVGVVSDVGIVIFSLYQSNIGEASANKIDVKLFCLLGKLKLIKAEVDEKCLVELRYNFPTTNALELIDLLLEKLTELESYEVDPISSFAKDRVDFLRSYLNKTKEIEELYHQTIKDDLLFLRSFLENILEQHIQNEKMYIQTMQSDLKSLRSFFEKNGEQHNQHEELQALSSRVTEVAYQTEFVIESLIGGDISYHSLMLFDNVIQEIRLVSSKAQKEVKISSHATSRARVNWIGASHQLSKEIKLVNSEDLKINDTKYVFKAQKAAETTLRNVLPQGSISTINKVILDLKQAIIDLKDEKQAVIDQLIGGPKQLDFISIVGMPGLGKTFLAQRVYHDLSIKSHFHILAWCCISQTFDKKKLLLEILTCIGKKAQYSEMNENDLAEKLYKQLKGKKYLIVLDDVWDIEAWNAFKISFPDDTNGSRILLTSRDRNITGKCHNLRRLTVDESWELLQKKLAITRKDGCPPNLEDLGRKIAKNCNGLPLSIVIISGILATIDQICWEEVAERLKSNSMIGATEQCKSILELSYIHLPDHLKPCLLYFGAFREDQEIPIQRLTWLWIAEGFVQKNESESLEKIAEGYVNALVNRSLVMVGQQSYIGGMKACRIHDLLHIFCSRKAKDQNFLQLIRKYDDLLQFDDQYHELRLSICCHPKLFAKSRIFCLGIRSLLHSSHGTGSCEVPYNLSFIVHLKLLKVLDLGQISLGFTFPSELGLLVKLRYLSVLGWIKHIPSSLGNLSRLETFLVTTYYSDVCVSLLQDTFWKMQKLRHLHVRGALIDLILDIDNLENSSILYNLDTLSTLKLSLGHAEKMMGKLANIRELKCCLLPSEESTSDSNNIFVDFFGKLESLKLLLGEVNMHPFELHLPLNLKRLTLEEFPWSVISRVGKLPNLEVLKLLRQANADGVKEWDMEEEEAFPNLKFLKLKELSISKWRGLNDHFPSLEKLVLEGCMKLEELPSCLGESTTLQLIEVHCCPELVGCLVQDIKDEQMNWGNEDLNILIKDEIEDFSSWSD